MKKFMMMAALFVMAATAVWAQEQKPAILVTKFDYNKDFKEAYCDQVRSKVIEGLTATQRFRVIDVASADAFSDEATRRLAESAMSDPAARQQLMSTLAAQFVLRGEVTTVDGVKNKMDDGSIYYVGNIAFTVHLLNPTDGTNIASETFTHNGLTADNGDTPVEAVNKTCERIVKDMRTFVDKNVRLGGSIVKIKEEKGGKAVTVYIDLGTADGLQKGQKLEAFQEVEDGGEIITEQIGELTVVEVVGQKRATCKVNKGGDKIVSCANEGIKMPVKTRAKKDVLGGFMKALN